MNRSYSKIRHIQESNQRLENRLLNEQVTTQTTTVPSGQIKTMTNKVATEGLKNITPEMVAAPPFEGEYSAYSIYGEFNGVGYIWDVQGVVNGSVRGIVKGSIGTETIENLCSAAKVGVPRDAKPKSLALQFASNDYSGSIFYTSTSGKVVSLNY
jgi:hypothetical protein